MILPRQKVLNIGDGYQYFAFGGVPDYIWHSSDPNVAEVDPNGSVTATGPGHTFINVTDQNGMDGLPARLAVPNPGDYSLSLAFDPNMADPNHIADALGYYSDTNDHGRF